MPDLISSRTRERMVPVLYLDLDGTVRWGKDELGHFVNTADDVRVFDEVPALLRQYKLRGWRIIGVSNQGGVALGYLDVDEALEVMKETQRQCRNAFDKIVCCTHHPDAQDPEMAVCWCRKPRIGMIVESALELSAEMHEIYPPHLGLMVGDMETDEQCAKNANLNFMYAQEWRAGLHTLA